MPASTLAASSTTALSVGDGQDERDKARGQDAEADRPARCAVDAVARDELRDARADQDDRADGAQEREVGGCRSSPSRTRHDREEERRHGPDGGAGDGHPRERGCGCPGTLGRGTFQLPPAAAPARASPAAAARADAERPCRRGNTARAAPAATRPGRRSATARRRCRPSGQALRAAPRVPGARGVELDERRRRRAAGHADREALDDARREQPGDARREREQAQRDRPRASPPRITGRRPIRSESSPKSSSDGASTSA